MSEVSDKIAKILEDPESLKMISQIADSFSGSMQTDIIKNAASESKENNDFKNLDSETNNHGDFSIISSAVGKLMDGGDVENTIRLVTALKPYMSHHRRESADSVLKILAMMRLVGSAEVRNMAKLFENYEK